MIHHAYPSKVNEEEDRLVKIIFINRCDTDPLWAYPCFIITNKMGWLDS